MLTTKITQAPCNYPSLMREAADFKTSGKEMTYDSNIDGLHFFITTFSFRSVLSG